MAASIDFSMSGQGPGALNGNPPLPAWQQLCIDSGYTKKDKDGNPVPSSKPLAQRADMAAMFKAYGVSNLSGFKQLFMSHKLGKGGSVSRGTLSPALAKEAKGKEPAKTYDCPDVSQYDDLAGTWEKGHKWRMIQKPGGAHMKPTDFYRLYGAVQQVTEGDCTSEQPMWADHGGLDFDGRERWTYWKKLEGMSTSDAKLEFCKVYGEAMGEAERNFRKY